MTKSPRFSLDDVDVKKIGTGLALAIAGAVAAFFAENATELNLGEWAPFVAAGAAVILNMIRKFVKGPVRQG